VGIRQEHKEKWVSGATIFTSTGAQWHKCQSSIKYQTKLAHELIYFNHKELINLFNVVKIN